MHYFFFFYLRFFLFSVSKLRISMVICRAIASGEFFIHFLCFLLRSLHFYFLYRFVFFFVSFFFYLVLVDWGRSHHVAIYACFV
ncbi:hypothetical protein TCDM_02423 [Trypanosoma cruzi Dm28c]|uniref:Uncharacterized protein n=1 Tax=Trypanosoma cruzi Dm28c TaxID=1416333 RepID=V5BW02_TRYCR|nr:hypothetical protein TCDM_02423 [Trypanosoma cruzi Dm28c]